MRKSHNCFTSASLNSAQYTIPPPSEGFEKKPQHPMQKHLDNDTQPDGDSNSFLPNNRSQKLPFGCGCGKCTLSTFIMKHCRTPTPTASSFPYLKLNELSNEQQQKLGEWFGSESQQIMMQFRELVSATMQSLISQCVPLDDLKSHVIFLASFNSVRKTDKPKVSFLTKPKTVDTIGKFFQVLDDYFSFFNYDVIEHIIKILGTEDDKARLQKYKEDFNQYAKRRIFECPPVSNTDHTNIFVKLDSHYEEYTDEEIKRFCQKLNKTFGLNTFCHAVM